MTYQGRSEIKLERSLVDARQRFEIVERDPLVDGMDRRVDRPSSTTGQAFLMKRASEVPRRSKARAPPRHVLNRFGDEIGERPGLGEKGDRIAWLEGQRRAPADVGRRHAALDLRGKRIGRPQIVEADVETEAHLARDDVERRVADIDETTSRFVGSKSAFP